jgi:CHAT domain-containing protein
LLRRRPVTDDPERLPFLGFGDPTFEGDPSSGVATARNYYRDVAGNIAELRKLPRLPGTRAEIKGLAATLGASAADVLLGPAANEDEIWKRQANSDLLRYRILAFATHGLVSGDLGGRVAEPALALSPPESPSPSNDGLLTASEAASLNLDADWVILSACNSAAGGDPKADGLTGLGKAFLLAGTRALLVSYWRVRDDAAARLTTRTLELMRADKSLSRGEALQASMRELMMDASSDNTVSFALPSAWAAFMLVGAD